MSATWFFVSDLHGRRERYARLFDAIARERPRAVLLGGDLLPSGYGAADEHDLLDDFLVPALAALRVRLAASYPTILLIFGNDDPRCEEARVRELQGQGVWQYLHGRRVALDDFAVYGYACVPPTPFLLKDWERYDVSRFVDADCVSPEEGWHSVPVSESQTKWTTIAAELDSLAGADDLTRAVFLFHTPPYRTKLDRAALDGKLVDHVPVDVHVGSIAVRRFIESRQPRVTLHGHVHESARLTGSWRDQIGRTHLYSAAHDGGELALVRFDPEQPELATRELL